MFLTNSRDPYEAIDTSHGSLALFFDFLKIIYAIGIDTRRGYRYTLNCSSLIESNYSQPGVD
jgi:hypothetical protein